MGSGDGQFELPYGVTVDASGRVYVADWLNHRIQVFDGSGAYLTQWGTYGTGPGQFDGPQGVAVSPGGSVYVADTYNNRIQWFTAEGNLLGLWGEAGSGEGQFRGPFGLIVSSGGIYVSDTRNQRIQKFDTLVPARRTTWGNLKHRYRPGSGSGG